MVSNEDILKEVKKVSKQISDLNEKVDSVLNTDIIDLKNIPISSQKNTESKYGNLPLTIEIKENPTNHIQK